MMMNRWYDDDDVDDDFDDFDDDDDDTQEREGVHRPDVSPFWQGWQRENKL